MQGCDRFFCCLPLLVWRRVDWSCQQCSHTYHRQNTNPRLSSRTLLVWIDPQCLFWRLRTHQMVQQWKDSLDWLEPLWFDWEACHSWKKPTQEWPSMNLPQRCPCTQFHGLAWEGPRWFHQIWLETTLAQSSCEGRYAHQKSCHQSLQKSRIGQVRWVDSPRPHCNLFHYQVQWNHHGCSRSTQPKLMWRRLTSNQHISCHLFEPGHRLFPWSGFLLLFYQTDEA